MNVKESIDWTLRIDGYTSYGRYIRVRGAFTAMQVVRGYRRFKRDWRPHRASKRAGNMSGTCLNM